MHLVKARLGDSLYLAGLVCLSISLIFFCLPFFGMAREGQQFPLFTGNFALTVIYFFLRLVRRKDLAEENRIHYTFLFLALFLVSAYSLNREMSVFDDSANWFSALIVTSCVNYIAFAFAGAMPKRTLYLMSFIAGISWMAFAYLSLYLFPLYAMGLVGAILFGVGLHTFVPVLFTYYSIRLLKETSNGDRKFLWSFLGGVGAAVAIVIIYALMWNSNKNKINYAWRDSIQKDNDLPVWVNVAEKVPDNFFTRKLMRTGLVYSTPNSDPESIFWRMPEELGEKRNTIPSY
jgi:XrtN system VIT domain protein